MNLRFSFGNSSYLKVGWQLPKLYDYKTMSPPFYASKRPIEEVFKCVVFWVTSHSFDSKRVKWQLNVFGSTECEVVKNLHNALLHYLFKCCRGKACYRHFGYWERTATASTKVLKWHKLDLSQLISCENQHATVCTNAIVWERDSSPLQMLRFRKMAKANQRPVSIRNT